MKDAVITVRVPSATRRRLEALARHEGRSLSAQIARLLDRAMGAERVGSGSGDRGLRALSGALSGGRTPSLHDFRAVRDSLSGSLERRARADDRDRR